MNSGYPTPEERAAQVAQTVEQERDALRTVLLRLGATVLDTDRWSGIQVGGLRRMVLGDERMALDFLPKINATSEDDDDLD